MARLHATWWGDPRLDALGWLPRLDGPARRHNLTTIARSGWEPLCDLLGEELTNAERALGDELPQRIDDVMARLGQLAPTLVHSDLRADNLLFSPNADAVTLVDWQGAGIGPAGWDLAYFLSQSLTVDTRRAHERDLLERYAAEAAQVRPDLTAPDLLAGYGESMIFGLVVAVSLPLVADPSQPRVRALARSMSRRAIEGLRDHGQLWGRAADQPANQSANDPANDPANDRERT
jgi:hypothetical protein